MRLIYCLLCLELLLSGCVYNGALGDIAASEINVINISRIEKGMTQAEVLKIMRHPYDDDVFHLDGDVYDIWFYVTEPRVLGQSRMMPANVTPLAFKNGILIGWGYRYYEFLRNRDRMAKQPPPPPKIEKPVEPENIELQRILKESFAPPPGQPSAAPSKQPPVSPPTKGAGGTSPNLAPPAPKPPSTPSSHPTPPPTAPKGGQSQPQPDGSNWEAIAPQSTPQSTPPTQPNWSPLEKEPRLAPPQQPPPNQPTPPIQPEQVPSVQTPEQLSMATAPKKKPSPPSDEAQKPQPAKEEGYPMDEGDQDMLEKERMQDFNQT